MYLHESAQRKGTKKGSRENKKYVNLGGLLYMHSRFLSQELLIGRRNDLMKLGKELYLLDARRIGETILKSGEQEKVDVGLSDGAKGSAGQVEVSSNVNKKLSKRRNSTISLEERKKGGDVDDDVTKRGLDFRSPSSTNKKRRRHGEEEVKTPSQSSENVSNMTFDENAAEKKEGGDDGVGGSTSSGTKRKVGKLTKGESGGLGGQQASERRNGQEDVDFRPNAVRGDSGPMQRNDIEPTHPRAVVDFDLLIALVGRVRCADCGWKVMVEQAKRQGLNPRIVLKCKKNKDHTETILLAHTLGQGKVTDVNLDFYITRKALLKNDAAADSFLRALGLNVPKFSGFRKTAKDKRKKRGKQAGRASGVRLSAKKKKKSKKDKQDSRGGKSIEDVFATMAIDMADEDCKKWLEFWKSSRDWSGKIPAASWDTQYSRSQRATGHAPNATSTLVCNTTKKIIMYKNVNKGETEEFNGKTYRNKEAIGTKRAMTDLSKEFPAGQAPKRRKSKRRSEKESEATEGDTPPPPVRGDVTIVHDQNATVTSIIQHYGFGECLDAWHILSHTKTNIAKLARKLEEDGVYFRPDELSTYSAALRKGLESCMRSLPANQRSEKLQLLEANLGWTNDSRLRALCNVVVAHYAPSVKMMERVDDPSTTLVESFHAHEDRFWSKKAALGAKMYKAKTACGVLSWNERKGWLLELRSKIYKKLGYLLPEVVQFRDNIM